MLIAAMLTVSGMDFHARDAAEVCNIKVVTDDLSYTVMITRLSGVPVRQASPRLLSREYRRGNGAGWKNRPADLVRRLDWLRKLGIQLILSRVA